MRGALLFTVFPEYFYFFNKLFSVSVSIQYCLPKYHCVLFGEKRFSPSKQLMLVSNRTVVKFNI